MEYINELHSWLDTQNILYTPVDSEVVDLPGFGKLFCSDLSGVKSIFRKQGDSLVFNLMESPATLMEEGIFHVAFPFGDNWYYYDLREEFRLNILKYIGRPVPTNIDVPFVNLGIHTPYELMNAAGDIGTWIRKAKWLGSAALGLCDRNTMAGTLAFQKECEKAGITPVLGYSLTLDCEDEDVDMKVYCQSQKGLQNLLRLQKEVMVDREDGKIGLKGLLGYAEGNVLVLGTLSSEWVGRNPKALEELQGGFGRIFYQVDTSEYKADRIDRQYLYALKHYFDTIYTRKELCIEPVLICDCYYPDRGDWRSKILLNKIASGAAHRQSDDQYYKTVDELWTRVQELFDAQRWNVRELFEKMCRNTVLIAQGAKARFELGRMYMPRYDMRPQEKEEYGDRRSMFRKLLERGLKEKAPIDSLEQYRKRLEEEIYIIESTNNVDYFLIQWDMICEARRRGIVTGIGRGSAGGSLVSYLLGITSIDPIKYDLLFSRFLVPERCGLFWKDVTQLLPPLKLSAGDKYVEVIFDDRVLRFDRDAKMRVLRQNEEITVYADELSAGDSVIMDNRDMLWNLGGAR